MARQLECFKRTMNLTLDGFSEMKLRTARYTLGDLAAFGLRVAPKNPRRVSVTLPPEVSPETLEIAYLEAHPSGLYSRRMFLLDLMIKGRYAVEGDRAIS